MPKQQGRSRNGCITCKAKRLKCDETKPSCHQCSRRGTTCGGYPNFLRWRAVNNDCNQSDGNRRSGKRPSTKAMKPERLNDPVQENGDAPTQVAGSNSDWTPPTNILCQSTTVLPEPSGSSSAEENLNDMCSSLFIKKPTDPLDLGCFESAIAADTGGYDLTQIPISSLEATDAGLTSDNDIYQATANYEITVPADEFSKSSQTEDLPWHHETDLIEGHLAHVLESDDSYPTHQEALSQQRQIWDDGVATAIQEDFMSTLTVSELNRLKFLASTWLYRDVIARLTCTNLVTSMEVQPIDSYSSLSFYLDERQIDPLMGCGTALFPLIGSLVKLVRRVLGRAENRNSPAIISKAIGVRMAIEAWVPSVDSDSPNSYILDLVQTAEAYQYASPLLLRQAVPELPASCSMSKLAQKTPVFLATISPSSRTIHAQIFPLMIAGCEAFDEDDQKWVRQRWDLMSTRMMTTMIDRCRDITSEVWRRRDEFEIHHGLRDLIRVHQPCSLIGSFAMDSSTSYDALRVPNSSVDGMNIGR
ncbi:hypothetical protein BBP40_000662 [Aspergillus hancockii]|nr:hypothetical protein BBP40_000662 [Aspergillus hancockii]